MTKVLLLLLMTACVAQLANCALDAGPDDGEAIARQLQAVEKIPSTPMAERCLTIWLNCVKLAKSQYEECVERGTPVTTCDETSQARNGLCERQYQDCMRASGSPIMIDLGMRGFSFTDARHGVDFDIDGDGVLDRTGWPARGAQDAFLARDLNSNGQIDDGKELFGDATELLDGTRGAHGYIALIELDAPEQGGNGDGYLDRWDDCYRDLLLWNDDNHDGISQPNELSGLLGRDIVALGLAYSPSPQIDSHGNRLAFVSVAHAVQGHRLVQRTMGDVFFVLEDPR